MPVWWIYGIAVPPWTHHSTKVWEKWSQRITITFGKTVKNICIKLLKDTLNEWNLRKLKTQSINTSNAKEHQNLCRWWDSNSQPLSYKNSALAIELISSKAIAGKELCLSSWCIASLCIYHCSTAVDFSSEKYSGSTGHRNSWYSTSREIFNDTPTG